MLRFYETLKDGLEGAGWACDLRALDRQRVQAAVAADDAYHIINHGRLHHDRVLNAGIAYVYPFWNLDPHGIRAFSSIRARAFRPGRIEADAARPFFRKLRARLVGKRQSRYAQPSDVQTVPVSCIAVFLQAETTRDVEESCYLDRNLMVETVLNATQQPVVIKPHPEDSDPNTANWLRGLAARHPHLHISDANIHDILSAAERVVTINSAVGIESYLHRTPVILCGQSDFHHIADVAQTPEALASHLRAPLRSRAYDKFIYWYFGQMCLSASDPELSTKVIDRLQNGVDFEGQDRAD